MTECTDNSGSHAFKLIKYSIMDYGNLISIHM